MQETIDARMLKRYFASLPRAAQKRVLVKASPKVRRFLTT